MLKETEIYGYAYEIFKVKVDVLKYGIDKPIFMTTFINLTLFPILLILEVARELMQDGEESTYKLRIPKKHIKRFKNIAEKHDIKIITD